MAMSFNEALRALEAAHDAAFTAERERMRVQFRLDYEDRVAVLNERQADIEARMQVASYANRIGALAQLVRRLERLEQGAAGIVPAEVWAAVDVERAAVQDWLDKAQEDLRRTRTEEKNA